MSGGSGGAEIIQLCTIDAETAAGYGGYNKPVNVNNALDKQNPYSGPVAVIKGDNPDNNQNIINLDDAPNDAGYDSFHFNGTFTDYVMFSPDDGIYVPLGKINWGTTFMAFYSDTYIYNDTVTPPTKPDGSFDFPVWTEVYNP